MSWEPGQLDTTTGDALRAFQHVYGIEETGYLDAATQEALESPRCGVPDRPVVAATRRGSLATFVLSGCSYQRLTFSYRFANGTGDIAGNDERPPVQRAFDTWASVLRGVTFTLVTGSVSDFVVGWFAGDHGDGSRFDGAGNVLAHAFYPPPCGGAHAGELHYDDAETWALNAATRVFDAETVALHEIGHLLGLNHSTVAGSVMFPTYGSQRRRLTQDDIDGIRRLYPALARLGDSGSQAGFVGEIAAETPPDGSTVRRRGDSAEQAGAANLIKVVQTGLTVWATPCQDGSGNLKVIAWTRRADGSFQRHADSAEQAGEIRDLDAAGLGNGLPRHRRGECG